MMKIYDSIAQIPPRSGSAVAIGLFDGLHVGHRAVISRALEIARSHGAKATVLTFDLSSAAHPAAKRADQRLITPSLFGLELEAMGVDELVHLPFSAIRGLSPAEFACGVLAASLSARAVCCGKNFRFGRGASAGIEELAAYGRDSGFSLEVLPLVEYEGETVSSTRIRACLSRGELGAVNAMLGRAYAFDFIVERGNALAREFGMPTANQAFAPGYAPPRFGVYASVATVDGKRFPTVTNIGVRPTVGSDHIIAETHIPGYQGDLYGRPLRVELMEFLRPEQKFSGLEALQNQMRLDLRRAVEITSPECGV